MVRSDGGTGRVQCELDEQIRTSCVDCRSEVNSVKAEERRSVKGNDDDLWANLAPVQDVKRLAHSSMLFESPSTPLSSAQASGR